MRRIRVQLRNKWWAYGPIKYTYVSDRWYALLSKYKWSPHLGYVSRSVKVNGKHLHVMMHRVIMGFTSIDGTHHDPSREVDHRDRNKYNNQDDNLREANHQEQSRNRRLHKNNKTGHTGVYFTNPSTRTKRKYTVQVRIGKKVKYLGSYDDFEEACRVHDEYAKRLYGEFYCEDNHREQK